MISCKSSEKNHSHRIDLCNPESYHGCLFTAEFNVPDVEWRFEDGIWIQFQVTSQNSNCATVLCQNDVKAPVNNNSCSFIYDQKYGTTLFVNSGCGGQSNMDSTLNFRIYCDKREIKERLGLVQKPLITKEKEEKKEKLQLSTTAICPTTFLHTKQTAKTESIQSVFTSTRTTIAKLFQIIVCGLPTQKIILDIAITGTDKYSAFSTYVCPMIECDAGYTHLGWYEDSGANFNHISISDLKPTILYFRVYGRGLHNHFNNFTISVDMKSYG